MSKIGILTIPRADNYGSVLQAYAMQAFVDTIEKDNEIIDYVSPFLVGRYPLWNIKKSKNPYIIAKSLFQNIMTLTARKKKKSKFENFRNLIRFSEKTIYQSNEIDIYDYYISGSDQIWNTRITQFDKTFFLDFVALKKKKIAFAVSMGYEDRKANELDFYKQELKEFNAIGIREKNDLKFIEELADSDTKCNYIIDPTLLIDEEKWKELIGKRKIAEKYILIYTFGRDERVVKAAKNISVEKKIPVYIVSDEWRNVNSDGFRNIKGVGPIEFINLIAFSEAVVTNSFHGTAFSIIFRKPFVSVPYESTGNRMISLLKLLNLESALYDENNLEYNVDYKNVDKILKEERSKARNFLLKAIGGQ